MQILKLMWIVRETIRLKRNLTKLLINLKKNLLQEIEKDSKNKIDHLTKIKETSKKEKTTETKKKPVEKEQKEGGSLKDFLPLLDVAKRLVASFFRKLRIRKLELKLILAGDDPCDLAVNYGKTWAATGSLIPMLEELFVIRKRDVDVGCDFTAEETKIYAAADITILTGRLLGLAGLYGFQALREYLKILKKRKGEHQNESKSS